MDNNREAEEVLKRAVEIAARQVVPGFVFDFDFGDADHSMKSLAVAVLAAAIVPILKPKESP